MRIVNLFVVLVSTAVLSAQSRQMAQHTPRSMDRVIAWMPAKTETLIAMNGPFQWPHVIVGPQQQIAIAPSGDAVFDRVQTMTLLDTLQFARPFAGATVLQMMSGIWGFRQPAGLGMALFSGATVIEFKGDVSDRIAALRLEPGYGFVRSEQIDGQAVLVYRVKSEEDLRTSLVAFPTNTVMVVAEDEASLREVMRRVGGTTDTRALPESLPEWRYVNQTARFWAMHHVQPNNPEMWLGVKEKSGAEGSGVTFAFDPATKRATITYLMSNEAMQHIKSEMWNDKESGVHEMEAQYRVQKPGVLVGTYRLQQEDSASLFMFVLQALLGRPISL